MNLFQELERRNVIRVAIAYVAGAWLLIQVLETLFPIFGLAETSIRIFVIILAVLFVPALMIAWAFEFTPEGLKLDSAVAADAPFRPLARKRLDRIIMVTLALAVGYFAFDKFVLDPAEDLEIAAEAEERGRSEALLSSFGEKSIAVLAFDDLSPEGDQEYFSDGIAEELLNLLARIPELRVAGRTSAFSFKGSNATIAEIGERLNVAHVLEGSVRSHGNKIRITAQLIEANTDTHLWSETYDREMGDIFAIQDEIAAHVVEELKVTLLEPPRATAVAPEALALYLRARHLINTKPRESRGEVVPLLEQALELEPDYVDALTSIYWAHQVARSPLEELIHALERARAVAPDDPEVVAMEAWTAMWAGEFVRAGELFEQAVNARPADGDIAIPAIWFSRFVGRPDLAIQLGEFIVARDPLCAECQRALAYAYRNAERYEDALALMEQIDGLFGLDPEQLAYVYLLKGEPEAVLETLENSDSRFGQLLIAMARDDLGFTTEAREALQSLEQEFAEDYPEDLASAYAWIDDADKAFEMWGLAVDDEAGNEAGEQMQVTIRATNPVFRKIYDDPRWQPFVDTYGIPSETRAAIDVTFNLPE